MQQLFKIYKIIDTAYAAKILFRLQEKDEIQFVKICAATGELSIETDKPLGAEDLKMMLNIPDLIIQKEETGY